MSALQIVFTNLAIYLVGFLVLIWLRHRVSEQSLSSISILINLVGVIMALGLSVLSPLPPESITWFTLGSTVYTSDLLFNSQTTLLYFIVQFVGFWVQIFSIKYLKGDFGYGRYFAYLNLFIASMLGVVVAGNLLLLYVFWELVGVCSYLLIGFWYEKKIATNAAKKAFMMNRIGDVGLLAGIFLVYYLTGTFSIIELPDRLAAASPLLLTAAGLLLFMGCVGKSAQFPLHLWLPDAMEGPTPASALIHAATMVAAGIFLMARVAFLLTPNAGLIIAIIGVFTALIAAYSALFQYDIKRMLAYSTVSQLGLMVMGIGVGATHAALFHLTTHAFFKAGLFLAAGAVIHYLHHEQDMRKMGGLRRQLPLVFLGYGMCAASLAGLPFFSGFLSKDALLLSALDWALKQPSRWALVLPAAAVVTSLFTAFYITRQFILVFFEREGSTAHAIWGAVIGFWDRIWSNSRAMLEGDDVALIEEKEFSEFVDNLGWLEVPVLVMALGSVFFIFSWNPFSMHDTLFSQAFPLPEHPEIEHYVILLVSLTVLSILLAYRFTKGEIKHLHLTMHQLEPKSLAGRLGFHHFFLNKVWYAIAVHPIMRLSRGFDHFELGSDILSQSTQKPVYKGFSKFLHRLDTDGVDVLLTGLSRVALGISQGVAWLEQLFVDGFIRLISRASHGLGRYTRRWQGGELQKYVLGIFITLVLLGIALLAYS